MNEKREQMSKTFIADKENRNKYPGLKQDQI